MEALEGSLRLPNSWWDRQIGSLALVLAYVEKPKARAECLQQVRGFAAYLWAAEPAYQPEAVCAPQFDPGLGMSTPSRCSIRY